MVSKPNLSPWQVYALCLGAFGIQFGFALPQANATRIFQNLGASLDTIPLLWLAGPITGLIVQPLAGYYSDRTWTRHGRRKPYFLVGAALAAMSLFAMPNATTLWMAALMLWVLDASLNLTMGPYRAFVADQMASAQRPTGYVTYMSLASVGAVIGSLLPWMFGKVGVSTVTTPGEISDAVKYAFALGATFLICAVCWSALSTREFPPGVLEKFDDDAKESPAERSPARMRRHAAVWAGIGIAGFFAAWTMNAPGQLYVLVAACIAYGLFLLAASVWRGENALTTIVGDLESMSASMRWLAVVQFFSWFALFAVFVYTTPAVAKMHFGAQAPGTPAYEAGANWVGVLFGAYNAFAAIAALGISYFVRRLGMQRTHQFSLWIGAIGLLSMTLIHDPDWLLASMVGVGIGWAGIIALPYAMLANTLPAKKMGVNIGIFNIFIVIPQLLAAGLLPSLLNVFGDGDPVYAVVIGAVGWFLAGITMFRVRS